MRIVSPGDIYIFLTENIRPFWETIIAGAFDAMPTKAAYPEAVKSAAKAAYCIANRVDKLFIFSGNLVMSTLMLPCANHTANQVAFL